MNLPNPGRHERAAAAFDNLASALDAGLPAREVLEGSTSVDPDRDPVAALEHGPRGVRLDPIERDVFAAAAAAGALPGALRERAEARRFFATLQRETLGALAYPLLLTCFALGVAGFVSTIGSGPGVPLAILAVVLGAVAGLAFLLVRSNKSPAAARWLPGPVRRALFDSAEIPYLSGLAALYGAGVPILEAHRTAADHAGVAAVRARLQEVAALADARRIPLSDALTRCDALERESLLILAPAEAAGDLENGLKRTVVRRRDVFSRRARRIAQICGWIAYGTAVLVVVYVVMDFYSGLLGRVR